MVTIRACGVEADGEFAHDRAFVALGVDLDLAVNAGEPIVGDGDGILVVRLDQLDGLMARCKARLAKEEAFVEKIRSGVSTVELQVLPPPEGFA